MKDYKHEIIIPQWPLPAQVIVHDYSESINIPAHWHQSIEISYTKQRGGKVNFFIDGKSYEPESGDILIVNTMEIHSIKLNKTLEKRQGLSIIFPYKYIERFFAEIDDYKFKLNDIDDLTNIQKKKYKELQGLFDDIIELYISGDNLKLVILLHKVLDVLLNNFIVDKKQKNSTNKDVRVLERLAFIKNYINDNYDSDLTLTSLAESCYISKEYLSRFFKEHMGVTVGDYINMIRAKHAKEHIYANSGNFTEISLMCGFSGLRSMNRSLVKYYGMNARKIKETKDQ